MSTRRMTLRIETGYSISRIHAKEVRRKKNMIIRDEKSRVSDTV
jgi:hypothetical protein